MRATSLALIKGTLDVLILKTLSREPMHGYAISRWIRSRSADVFQVEEGALYPALRRLESKGLIAGEWGTTDTGRDAKVYALTEDGEQVLHSELRDWSRYVEAMTRVLETPRARA